jgi:hypothetical protein
MRPLSVIIPLPRHYDQQTSIYTISSKNIPYNISIENTKKKQKHLYASKQLRPII